MHSQKKFLPQLYPLDKEIRKGKMWFVQFTGVDGRKKKLYGQLNNISTVEGRLKEAEILIKQVLEGGMMQPAHGISNQLIKDLQAVFDLREEGWSKKSKSAFQTHFFAFALWYRNEGCPTMNVLQAARFLNSIKDKGNNNTTRNNYRRTLKSLFRSLNKYYKHRYPENPFADTDFLRQQEKTKEWFRPEQVNLLKKEISKRDPLLLLAVRFMVHCFPRPNEIRQLRVKNIIWETQKLRIESVISKTVFVRHVHIPDSLFVDLLKYKSYPGNYFLFTSSEEPGFDVVGVNNLNNRHREILQSLKIGNGFSFYGWKNTGAVKMLCQDKKNIRYISKCMGHHSLDMTDRYFQSLGVDEMDNIRFPEI